MKIHFNSFAQSHYPADLKLTIIWHKHVSKICTVKKYDFLLIECDVYFENPSNVVCMLIYE